MRRAALRRCGDHLGFVAALIARNLSSAMAYRASFISQIVGMFLNNGIYLVFWLIFFDRFGAVRGYESRDIFLLFGVVACGHGLAYSIAGNNSAVLATLIAHGRLDYYLALPRPVLLHAICSGMQVSAIGDFAFGLTTFALAGHLTVIDFSLFLLAAALAASLMAGYGVIAGSLAFFMGNAQHVAGQATNALLTFGLYPNALFGGGARLLLFTLLPAAFVGAVPVNMIQGRDGRALIWLLVANFVVWFLALAVFHTGLRRYESGSAINLNI